jgi:hypothetical protein
MTRTVGCGRRFPVDCAVLRRRRDREGPRESPRADDHRRCAVTATNRAPLTRLGADCRDLSERPPARSVSSCALIVDGPISAISALRCPRSASRARSPLPAKPPRYSLTDPAARYPLTADP